MLIVIILVCVFMSSWWLINGNMLFHTDIARDLYLVKDIVVNKHLTLIGARAGGIAGVFHGPLWLYVNLPAFVVGKGNPLAIGWFWLGLHILLIGIVYFVASKMFDKKVALWAAALAAASMILDVHGYINPQGAVIIFPLFFYLYWIYRQNKKWQYMVASLFLVGCLIQFEIAFGGPILLLVVLDGLRQKRKDWWCYLILFIPLSSYILFELRHGFLQTKAVMDFVGGGKIDYSRIIYALAAVPLLLARTNGIGLLVYFWIGFWLLSLLFKGQIWGYYWMGFWPVIYIMMGKILYKFKWILVVLIVFGMYKGYSDIKKYQYNPRAQDVSTWATNREVVQWILSRARGEFGYYVYTPDLYGYGPAYAVDLMTRGQRNIKLSETFLIMLPNVSENPYGRENWKSGEVKINREADEKTEFENGIKVERYWLSEVEKKRESNPLMIKDVFFR